MCGYTAVPEDDRRLLVYSIMTRDCHEMPPGEVTEVVFYASKRMSNFLTKLTTSLYTFARIK